MPRPRKTADKTEKSRKKRELILRAAAHVFRESGYAHATLSDIAAEADTFSGSLYYYFSSKEHLVEEVLNRGTTNVSDVVMKRMSREKAETDPLKRLQIALEAHMYEMLKRDDFIVAYWKIIDQVPPEIRERHIEFPKRYGRFWSDLIHDGQQSGQIRSDLDPTIIRLLLLGSSIYTLMWFREEGPLSVEDIAATLIEVFVNGLRPEAAERRAASLAALGAPIKPLTRKKKAVGPTLWTTSRECDDAGSAPAADNNVAPSRRTAIRSKKATPAGRTDSSTEAEAIKASTRKANTQRAETAPARKHKGRLIRG